MSKKIKSPAFQKYLMLIILSLGAGLIYKVAYLREVFYEPLRTALGVSNEDLGALSTMYGTIAMFCYIPGGILADKFKAKYLLIFSFISTGILTLWYATIPSYGTIKLIMALMAITTCLTFWTAFLKGIRLLGTDKEQGKMYGFSEGLRCVFGIAQGFVVLFIIEKAATAVGGLQTTLIFFGVTYIAVGVLAFFLMPNKTVDSSNSEEDSFRLSDVIKALKIPGIWLTTIVIFGIYNIYVLQSYTTPYMQNVWAVPTAIVGAVGIIRQYGIGVLSGPVVGIVGDKVGSPTKTLSICTIVLGASIIAFMVSPSTVSYWFPVILTVILGFMVFAVRGVQYAVMPEAQIPLYITGTATGIISTIGYLPDVYIYKQVGRWLDIYSPEKAYHMIFMYMILMAVIVFLATLGILKLSRDAMKNKKTEKNKGGQTC